MIPRVNDFIEMAELIGGHYSGTDISNMVIEFRVGNGVLQKINEELFYRNNSDKLVYGRPEPTDEIIVIINNITFRCVSEEEGDGR